MLIKDKFNPIFLKDYEINKKLSEKYKNFYDKDYIQDTIIYGNKGSGKYTFVNSIINSIYKTHIKKHKTIIKLGSKEFKLVISNYHFEILLDKYNNNFNNLCDIINYLTESKEINDICALKIIVIRNISSCKNDLLLFLKSKIEKSGNNYRFFLITDRISAIKIKYKGFFHCINVPYENKEIIANFFEKNIDNFNKKLFNNILKYTSNLNVLLTDYELGLLNKSKSFLDLKFTKIFNFIKDANKNPENIIKIRDEIYEINIKNIDFQIILKKILSELLSDKTIDNSKKQEIIYEYSKYSKRIVTCYKEQIHYESLICNLIYIYHK
jgi:hypothetical protein